MKIIITTLLTVSGLWTFAQEPHSGTYFTRKKDIGFESDIFQFYADGTFNYIFFTCTGTGLGKGKYEIIAGDSLRLQFKDCLKCEDKNQVETVVDSSDSLEISLKVREWAGGSELPGVNVYFPKEMRGAVTNDNGHATFTMPRSDESRMLQISFVGYDPVNIEVPSDATQIKGTVYLAWHWIYDSSDIKTYKILKWTRSKLKLKRYPDLAVTYKKVNSNKTDGLIGKRMGGAGYQLYIEKIKPAANTSFQD